MCNDGSSPESKENLTLKLISSDLENLAIDLPVTIHYHKVNLA